MIIVTGGAGFIGSNILAALEDRGEERLVAVDNREADLANISKRKLSHFLLPDELFEFCIKNRNKIKAIVHMGATSSTLVNDASLFFVNNYLYSLKIWEYCSKFQFPLIYASSAATYGDGSMGFDDTSNIESLAKFRPLNLYGRSKHLFDRKIQHKLAHGHAAPPQWVGLKFFNVYGPNEYHKGNQRSVIATAFPDAVSGKPIKLFKSYNADYSDGQQLRDFVWVGDCVKIVLWLLDNNKVNGIFNVGTGQSRSFSDLAESIFIALGMKINIEYIDMPKELRSKYQYFTEAQMNRLAHAGYKHEPTSLIEGVRTYIQKYLIKKDPYK